MLAEFLGVLEEKEDAGFEVILRFEQPKPSLTISL